MASPGPAAFAGGLEDFLGRFQIEGGRCPTHTRFGGSYGSYYMPVKDNERFFRVYARHVSRHRFSPQHNGRACIGLVERHRDFGPVVVDLDFRFSPATDVAGRQHEPRRRHSKPDIMQFIRKYVNSLAKWVVMPRRFEVVVMEKPGARMDKGVVKDGVHIVIPGIVTHTRVQALVRRDFIASYEKEVFADLGTENRLVDIFDEAVIQRNGWMMYGSGKENDSYYEVKWSVVFTKGFCEYEIQVEDAEPPADEEGVLRLVRLLSIRNKDEHTPVLPECESMIEQAIRVEEMARSEIRRNPRLQDTETGRRYATTDDYEMARRLAGLLDADRADSYMDWMKAGWCLHNIDDRLLNAWISFSQLSSKFEAGLCENLWGHMTHHPDGLGLGSLRRWACQDNPVMYDRIVKECVSGRVQAAITGLHHDVAMVVKGLYFDRFVCSSIRNNTWFQFEDHRWKMCDSGYYLRRLLSVDIFNRFTDEAMSCNILAQRLSAESHGDQNSDVTVRHTQLTEMYRKLNEVAVRLKSSSFKDNVMRECRELFYKPNFESRLDTKPNLIGFTNGVYDLDNFEFREGGPEDMVSYTTHYPFVHYDEGHECIQQLLLYFSQVQPEQPVREYLLRLMGSWLNGNIREERFHLFLGYKGSNSKSICIDLFERTLGDYACKLPIALLTQKRAASNAATSEIARLKGRRFACMQEPSNNETFEVGILKELTGGDKIQARPLYREPIEFKSFARLALICNRLPAVPSSDGGTWRRLRVIDFPSRFCRDPDPDNPHEFPMDTTIMDKLDSWAPHLMALLIQKYRVYCVQGNREPPAVLQATREYQESQDSVQLFINQTLRAEAGGEVRVSDLHGMYRDWLKQMQISGMSQRRTDFVRDIENHLNIKAAGVGSGQKLTGYALRAEEDDEADGDD